MSDPVYGTDYPDAQNDPPDPRQDEPGAVIYHFPRLAADQTTTHTDDHNALRLVEEHGERLRYCADRGRWYVWDGAQWKDQPAGGGAAREIAKDVARTMPTLEKSDVAWRRKSLSDRGISSTLAMASTIAQIAITYNELDAHPWELNTPAGIVDLRTGVLHPHDPAKLHSLITRCAPGRSDGSPVWNDFLATTFGADAATIAYVQRLVGYSAVGEVGAHVLPFCHGSGGNGKGVFLEAAQAVLGDYGTAAPPGFLMTKANAAHETEIASLSGKRMVVCSEVNESDRFDEAKVKQLTGGDTITARFMRADHFTFTPTHQLWLMGNTQPEVRTGGRSFWRRLRLLAFDHEVPEADRVDGLQEILADEHGGAVLAWIIAGAVDYANGGLRDPDSVRAATEAYKGEQDTVEMFLAERCTRPDDPTMRVKVSALRGAYERWCAELGEQTISAKALTQRLQRQGIVSARDKNARYYERLLLLADEDEAQQRW